MANGDTVVVVHTIRNEAGVKEVRMHICTTRGALTFTLALTLAQPLPLP